MIFQFFLPHSTRRSKSPIAVHGPSLQCLTIPKVKAVNATVCRVVKVIALLMKLGQLNSVWRNC